MYAVDTNIFVDFLRGRLSQGLCIMKGSDPELFKVPAVVEAELLLGALKSREPEASRRAVEQLLLPFEVLPFDSRCARHYADIRAHLERQGTPIGPNDLLIAATARAHGAVLATNNVREFLRVPGLSCEAWGEVDPAPAKDALP